MVSDIAKLNGLETLTTTSAADALENDIARRISSLFSVRSLASNADIVTYDDHDRSLAVHLDPTFDEATKSTLRQAAKLFTETALDEKIIRDALERATDTPPPMPEMYQMKDGQPIVDEVGRQIFSDGYAFYLQNRCKPANVSSFRKRLKCALSSLAGDPSVLFITRYTGNVWWGGSWYGFFSHPAQQLALESPSRGYLSIRLNADKLSPPEPNWNCAEFWASKIAHEVLHNLGYWHPNYVDPGDRDSS